MRKNMTGFFMLVVLCCGSLQADTETLKLVKGTVDFFTGTVKSFNDDEGYGLIEPDNGGADVCVYISALEQAGLSTLSKGDDVIYDLETINGRTAAVNIAVLYY